MSQYLNIRLLGVDGSVWHLAGDEEGAEGVEMRPKNQKLIDAPANTLWSDSGYKPIYMGSRFKRRDPVFSLNIFSQTGDPDDWHDIDSELRMALGMYDQEFVIEYETKDGVRRLPMRLLEDPKAYETADYEGRDPHLYGEATLVVMAASATRFWAGDKLMDVATFANGSGTQYVTVQNPGDVVIFPRWFVPAPCTVTLPDRSGGSDVIGKGVADANRVWQAPRIYAGEDMTVDLAPDMPPLVAANGANLPGRAIGMIFYPIQPHTPPTQVPVSMTGGPSNAKVYVELDQWFSRPWGVYRFGQTA